MTARYSTSRQKACRQCADAKARCDRNSARCDRCRQRGLNCSYVSPPAPELTGNHPSTTGLKPLAPLSPASDHSIHPRNSLSQPILPGQLITTPVFNQSPGSSFAAQLSQASTGNEKTFINTGQDKRNRTDVTNLSFVSLELVCPIQADEIRNRWLNPYVPVEGQTIKTYPANVGTFIFRTLKSFAAASVRGHVAPPFIHPVHMSAGVIKPPLSTCLSLVRVCHQPLPGSETAAASMIKQEMTQIRDMANSYDELGMLFAFQAYLIYCMVLFFQMNHRADPFLREAMLNLQDLASSSSRQGLECTAEQRRIRPSWEAWTVAEAKRRTLLTMYLFDSVMATEDGLPTFLGTELRGLPVPGAKSLWRSGSRAAWEDEYNFHLAQWSGCSLKIEELWPAPENMDDAELEERKRRADHWLEDADEFGMMLYTVTSCTHGA